jgi:type IV pilus assembly protein PilO
MGNLSELSSGKQWMMMLMLGGLVSAAVFFFVFRGVSQENQTAQNALTAKLAENAQLEAYRPKLAEIERQLANLKQQLEIERHIVPDEKQADDFMRMVQGEAGKAGIEVRRYTARAVSAREYYSEVPFELELDGPYYGVVNFLDRLGKMERIVNVSGLLMATPKKQGEAKVKKTYQYAPGESVVATCVATTFFSHDLQPAAAAPAGRR